MSTTQHGSAQGSVDNWALTYAQKLAIRQSAPLHVVFSLVPKFLDATLRQYDFLLKGLREVAVDLESKNIPFHLQLGKAGDKVPALVNELSAQMVVCDMSPLRVPSQWARDVADACHAKEVPVVQVDAHNVVPVWAASDKQETAARTIRKKIMQSLGTYLTEFPRVEKHPHKSKELSVTKATFNQSIGYKPSSLCRSTTPFGRWRRSCRGPQPAMQRWRISVSVYPGMTRIGMIQMTMHFRDCPPGYILEPWQP